MASIKRISTIVKRVSLVNAALNNKGLAKTLLVVGPHGIGKTKIITKAAQDLNGYCWTIEGGTLTEGVIGGLPFAFKNDDGTSELRFIKYYVVNNCFKLEKYYYNIALNQGFDLGVDGILKARINNEKNAFEEYLVTKDSKGKEVETVLASRNLNADTIAAGEDNAYKLFETIPYEYRLKLLQKGHFKIAEIFIDELNRADREVMKELMNVLLEKSVNGYEFPWWVNFVGAINPASQNSTYAANEMDPAQLSRFIKIAANAKLDEWVDYALDKGLDPECVAAVATSENIFIHKDSSFEDTDMMLPDPRAWEMVIDIIKMYPEVSKLPEFFSAEERSAKCIQEDLKTTIAGKVGDNAASTFLMNLNDAENIIKPTDILTAKAPTLDAKIVAKFNAQRAIRKKITSDSVIRYLMDNLCEFEKNDKSSDPKVKATYFNIMSQIKEFVAILDDATQLSFAKKLTQIETCLCTDKKPLYAKISKCFAKDMIAKLAQFRADLDGLK